MEQTAHYAVRGIPGVLIERFWPFALPYIKRALDHASGEYLPDDLLRACLNQDMQLWLVSNEEGSIVGAITSEIISYPQRTLCRIITLTGRDFQKWVKDAEKTIIEWAREQGCDGMEAWVRRGFIPFLKDIGYRPQYSVVVKDFPYNPPIQLIH